jgi:cobalt-zinc-cadmium efflux system protein
MTHTHDHAHGAGHAHVHVRADTDARALTIALALIAAFMGAELVAGILAHSLALLSDAAHMLTDAAALALALFALRIARRPPRGAMTYGFGRVEILSAQANGITLVLLALWIVVEAIQRLVSPPDVEGAIVVVVALAGVVVNLAATFVLAGASRQSLNVEGSFQHILTDLFAFVATAIAGAIVLLTGFARADALASLLVAASMLYAGTRLAIASGRVFLEAAPEGLDPQRIGRALAAHAGVVQVHDLHVWEVTSGFPALSAHVVVGAGRDCHELRRALQQELAERFDLRHTTLQVDHEAAVQPPLQIEVAGAQAGAASPSARRQPER